MEIPAGMEGVLHWVDGDLLIKPDYKLQQEAELRRARPDMTELQIQAAWEVLGFTLGIGFDKRVLVAGEALLAALEAGDGRAALKHFNEVHRLDLVAADGFVKDTRRKLTPGGAAARWQFATRRCEAMIAALEVGDGAKAQEELFAAARVEPGVAAAHVEVARRRKLL